MRKIVDLSEAEARVEEPVALVEAGEKVVMRRDGAPVARLETRNGLSAHDAAYLEAASRQHSRLATLDKKLAAAATPPKVLVLGAFGAL